MKRKVSGVSAANGSLVVEILFIFSHISRSFVRYLMDAIMLSDIQSIISGHVYMMYLGSVVHFTIYTILLLSAIVFPLDR